MWLTLTSLAAQTWLDCQAADEAHHGVVALRRLVERVWRVLSGEVNHINGIAVAKQLLEPGLTHKVNHICRDKSG